MSPVNRTVFVLDYRFVFILDVKHGEYETHIAVNVKRIEK